MLTAGIARVFGGRDVLLDGTVRRERLFQKGVPVMNVFRKLALAVVLIPVVALADSGTPAPAKSDPTKFDCRVVVYRRVIESKGRKVEVYRVMECPFKDKMAAGQCEYSWWRGMRCKS